MSSEMYGVPCAYNGTYGVLGGTEQYMPNTVVMAPDTTGSIGAGYAYGAGMSMMPQSIGPRESYQASAVPLVPQMYSYLPMQFVPMQLATQMYPPSAVTPFAHAPFQQQYGLPYPYWNFVSPVQTTNPSQLPSFRQPPYNENNESFGPEST